MAEQEETVRAVAAAIVDQQCVTTELRRRDCVKLLGVDVVLMAGEQELEVEGRESSEADGDLTVIQMDAYLPAALSWHNDLPNVCWSSSASCGPAPVMALMDALADDNWERATELTEQMTYSFETFFPNGDMAAFSRHTPAIVKERMREAGFLDPGPVRPPNPNTPESYLEGGRESGRRWKGIVAAIDQYSAVFSGLCELSLYALL